MELEYQAMLLSIVGRAMQHQGVPLAERQRRVDGIVRQLRKTRRRRPAAYRAGRRTSGSPRTANSWSAPRNWRSRTVAPRGRGNC